MTGKSTLTYVEETESTNDLARKALIAGVDSGTIFRAGRQTAGRGRHGRTWESREGDLFMSIVLRPAVDPALLPSMTLAVGLAARTALAQFGLTPDLKWPNDLLVSGRKLAGILVEGVFEGSKVIGVIAGLGVNVASLPTDFPAPLTETVTSFNYLEVERPDLDELAVAIGRSVASVLLDIEAGNLAAVLDEWRAHDVTIGSDVSWRGPNGENRGRAVGLSATGALVVDLDDGGQSEISSGEVTINSLKRGNAEQ